MKHFRFGFDHPLIIGGFVVAVLAAVASGAYLQHGRTDAAAESKQTPPVRTVPSQFSFGGAAGWRKGPANATSLALFSDDGSCFTSMEYKPGVIDVTTELQKQQNSMDGGGASMTPLATMTATVKADGAVQQYDLHRYRLSGGGEQLMGGLELGYVQLPKGYITVQGHCNTADQLPGTVVPLQAYRFSGNN